MSGYRRLEPGFCRSCGQPWTPGADACPSCHEVLFRTAPHTDPHALACLRRVLIAAFALLAVRWAVLLAPGIVHATALQGLLALGAAMAAAVVTARWWFSGKLGAALRMTAPPWAWVAALGLGAGVPVAFAYGLGITNIGGFVGGPAAIAYYEGHGLAAVGLIIALSAFEEIFFRGLLFDGVERMAGRASAAMASMVVFAFFTIDPFLLLVGGLATGLRAWSGAFGPALVLRVLGAVTWLACLHQISG